MTVPPRPFYFIRHGETDWNRNRIVMGQQDVPLNSSGIAQAQKAAQNLAGMDIASIVSSPLKRAAKTAEIIGETIRKPVTFIDDLMECGWGCQEGKAPDDGTLFQNWIKGRGHAGAETAQGFQKRILSGLIQALELAGPVLIVAHGGVYVAIRRWLSLPIEDLYNCAVFYHRPPEHPSAPWFACDVTGDAREDA